MTWSHRRTIGIILACMVGSALLSWLALIHQSLRLDEAQSLWQTSHSIGGTLRVVAQDVHVPLYHVILHFWQLYFGNDIVMVRLLSLMFFLINIPLIYLLARQVLTRGWALFTTALFSFLPFMDWYANEARMYTLLCMMATLSQYYFIRILRDNRGWRGYGITALIGVYSHYFFSFELAAQAIFFWFNRRHFAPHAFKRFISIAVLVGLALLPWLVYFVYLGAAKNTSPLLLHPSTVDFFNAFSQFLFGFQDNYVNTVLVSSWPLIVLLAFFGVKRGQQLSPEISYIATAALLPVFMAYALSFIVTPFFLSRYMISSVPPLLILVVWLMSHYSRRWSQISASLLVLALIVMSFQQLHSPKTPVKADYQGVAQTIAHQASPQDVIVMSAPFTVYPFEYYYNGPAQITTLPIWNRQATGAIPAFSAHALPNEVKQLNQNHRYVYLILSENQGYETTIKQYYLHHFKQISHHTYSPDLNLYVFQVGYNSVPPLGAAETLIKPTATAADRAP